MRIIYKFRYLIAVLVLALIFITINVSVVIETPYSLSGGDIASYIAMIEYVKIHRAIPETNLINNQPWLYTFTPTFYIITAMLSLVSGTEVPYTITYITILMPLIMALAIFLLSKTITGNNIVALLSAFFLLSVGSEAYMYTATPVMFSNIFFFLTVFALINLVRFQNISYKKLGFLPIKKTVLFFILFFLMVTSHHESAIRYTIILIISLFVLYFLHERKLVSFKEANSVKLLGVFTIIIGAALLSFATIFGSFGFFRRLNIVLFTREVVMLKPFQPINPLDWLGMIVTLFSIIGTVYMLLSLRERYNEYISGKLILLTWLFVTLVMGYQWLFGLTFYPNRAIWSLLWPASILAGYGTYKTLYNLNNLIQNSFIKNISIGLVLLLVLVPSITSSFDLAAQPIGRDWNYTEAILWAKNNLKEGKVMGDAYIIYDFQIIFVNKNLKPSYEIYRTMSDKVLYNMEPVQRILLNPNATEVYQYMKDNDIRYVIVEYPLVLMKYREGNNEKFKTSEHFKEIYSINNKRKSGQIQTLKIFEITSK